MGTIKQRVKAAVEKAHGRIQRTAGAVTGDTDLEARGRGREAKGQLRSDAARAVQKGKAKLEQAAGKAQRKLGEIAGNTESQIKGTARQAKGELREPQPRH
jgi:uncharacterized protein YjbJ (UPF0337 family)